MTSLVFWATAITEATLEQARSWADGYLDTKGKAVNTPPTTESVRQKIGRPGALFARDEVQVLLAEIDRLQSLLPKPHPPSTEARAETRDG